MKKLITLLIVLICCVCTAGAENITVRIIAVDKNSYAGYEQTPYIHIYTSTNEKLTGEWDNSPAMTHYRWDGEQNWYYYDLTADDSKLKSVKWIFRNGNKDAQTPDMSEGVDLSTSDYYCWINSSGMSYYPTKYYLYNITTASFTELSNTYGQLTGSIDVNSFSGEYNEYLIVPEYAKNNIGDNGWGWKLVFRPKPDGEEYWVNNFSNYSADGEMSDGSKKWRFYKQSGITYDISYNIRTNAYTLSPYFTRSIAASGYATYSSEYDAAIPEGVKAYCAPNLSDEKYVNLTKVTGGLSKNSGFLLTGTPSTEYKFYATNETLTAPASNLLQPSVTETNITASTDDNNYYFFASQPNGPGFYRVESATTSAAGKAYLATGNQALGAAPASGDAGSKPNWVVSDEVLDLTVGSEVTAISNVTPAAQQPMREGVYTITGVRVAQPTKGIYIVNGKKVVVK